MNCKSPKWSIFVYSMNTHNYSLSDFITYFKGLSTLEKKYVTQLLQNEIVNADKNTDHGSSLKSSVLVFVNPFEPVAFSDWEVIA